MLFRAGVKLYIDRQRNKEGSRIRSKLLVGALVLTLAPALFYVVFSFYVLNRHLDAWFGRNIQVDLQQLDASYKREAQERVQAETNWLSLLPETREAAETGHIEAQFFRQICTRHGIRQVILTRPQGVPLLLYQLFKESPSSLLKANADVMSGQTKAGQISVVAAMSADPAAKDPSAQETKIWHYAEAEFGRLKLYRTTYLRLIGLITVFVFFFASWAAQILSRQISIPISALLGAAQEVRRGNLSYRVRVNAMDELATLSAGLQ